MNSNSSDSQLAMLRYLEAMQLEGAALASRIARCTLDYYVGVATAISDYGTSVIATLAPTVSDPASGVLSEPLRGHANPTPIELHFSNEVAEAQEQHFVVANHLAENLDVQFEISEFVSEDGAMRTHVPVDFVPNSFSLARGEEQIVRCLLQLNEALAGDRILVAAARVATYPQLQLRLIVAPKSGATA